ncbi:titin homolog isoform X2 [Salmo trutta]|uniref:titin homolog isoform X2 n=1 Tax=Salmo trutta TaxID=8032 RepID=UPI0011321061|nr:titin homolog isoform X2 [Salmo trutta]
MTKKRTQTTSFTPPQPRSLRSRKRKCCDESEEIAPSGEAVEAQPSHLEQDTEGRVLNTTSPPKDPHHPLTACTTHPSQQANKAGDTTAPKQEGDPVEESPVVTGFEGEQAIGGAVERAGTEEAVPTNQDGGDSPQEDHSVESSVKDDEGKEEEDIKTQSFLSFPPHPLTVAVGVGERPQPFLLPSKEVNVGDGDSQTDNEEEQCGEKNPKPKMEELDSEQQEAIDDRGVCLGVGREGPPVEEDRSVEAPVKKRKRRMGMCGLGERERRERRRGGEMVLARKAEEEKVEKEREEDIGRSGDSGGGDANLVAVEGTAAASSSSHPSLLSSIPPSAPLGSTTEQTKNEKEEEEKLDEEQLQSGGEASHAGPSEVAYSGPEQVTGEGLRTGLEVDVLGSEQPVVLGEEELDTEGVVEKNQEGDREGCGSNEPEESPPRAPTPSTTTTPTSIPLEAGTEREHHGEVQSSPTQRERGAEDGAGAGTVANPQALSLAPADRVESTMPPPTKPSPGREGNNQAAVTPGGSEENNQAAVTPGGSEENNQAAVTPGGSEENNQAAVTSGGSEENNQAAVTPGGSEENNHSTTPDLTRADDDATVVDPFGALALNYVSDSQLNTMTEEEEKEGGHEDATELVCGLIRELSYLNRVVMATRRELESLRRGNKTARPPPRRIFPPRRSEI